MRSPPSPTNRSPLRQMVFLFGFFVLGAAFFVGGVELYARLFISGHPPLEVLTGSRAVSSSLPLRDAKTRWRILWLSSTPLDTAAVSKEMTRQLEEPVEVVFVGHPTDDAAATYCRYRHIENEADAEIVVFDQGGSPATLKGFVRRYEDGPCVIDDDNVVRTRIDAGPYDETLRFMHSFQTARIWLSRKKVFMNLEVPPVQMLEALNVLGHDADPIFMESTSSPEDVAAPPPVQGDAAAKTKSKRGHKKLKPVRNEAGEVEAVAVATQLVNHIRERAYLLKTSEERTQLPKTMSKRAQLALAAAKLDALQVDIAGVNVDKGLLEELAATPSNRSLTKAVRVKMRRPVDVEDMLGFLDDAIEQAYGLFRKGKVVLTPGRARRVGVFVHPDEVFPRKHKIEGTRKRTRKQTKPRLYPGGKAFIAITEPQEPDGLVKARDGDALGPNWYLRFKNPEREKTRLNDLVKENQKFGSAVQSLVSQLRAQGAEVTVESTVRAKERGYLMWGAFWLSRSADVDTLNKRITILNKLKKKWGVNVDIRWKDGDFGSNMRAAHAMAETYGVVYATKRGAEKSDHYDGDAVDITAVGLPARLKLRPTKGKARIFDLTDDEATRDLSLSPALISFIERGFKMKKLKGDYPHWSAKR